jgi:hypothetical protein
MKQFISDNHLLIEALDQIGVIITTEDNRMLMYDGDAARIDDFVCDKFITAFLDYEIKDVEECEESPLVQEAINGDMELSEGNLYDLYCDIMFG